jgi:hypothetical protein
MRPSSSSSINSTTGPGPVAATVTELVRVNVAPGPGPGADAAAFEAKNTGPQADGNDGNAENDILSQHDQLRLVEMLNDQQVDKMLNKWFKRKATSPRMMFFMVTTALAIIAGAIAFAVLYTNLQRDLQELKSGEALKADAVSSDKIKANSVTADKIAPRTITATEIQASSITSDVLAPDAVTQNKIKEGAVDTTRMADNAITSQKLASSAVESDNIATGAVTQKPKQDQRRSGGHNPNGKRRHHITKVSIVSCRE